MITRKGHVRRSNIHDIGHTEGGRYTCTLGVITRLSDDALIDIGAMDLEFARQVGLRESSITKVVPHPWFERQKMMEAEVRPHRSRRDAVSDQCCLDAECSTAAHWVDERVVWRPAGRHNNGRCKRLAHRCLCWMHTITAVGKGRS